MKSITIALLAICSGMGLYAQPATDTAASCSGGGCCCSPDRSRTPLGVNNDHIHDKGQWMVSYTYMNMQMRGNRMGAASVSDATVFSHYMMAPETMSMQMHMGMVMYGVTDKLTLMAMGGFAISNMSMTMSDATMSMPGMVMTPGNMTMKTITGGFTDTKISALYNFSGRPAQRIIGGLGISLPTGAVTATGTTTLGDGQRAPYNMQPGTGSYSIMPGLTYVRSAGLLSYGADAGAELRLDNNAQGYRWGNTGHATMWAACRLLPFVSGSLRAEGVVAGKMTRTDSVIELANKYENNDPTAAATNYGGQWVSLYAGLNFHFSRPSVTRFALLVEYGMPVYQNLNGVQMALRSNLLAGVQYGF